MEFSSLIFFPLSALWFLAVHPFLLQGLHTALSDGLETVETHVFPIQAQLWASPFLTLLWLNWCGHSCWILSYSHRSIDFFKKILWKTWLLERPDNSSIWTASQGKLIRMPRIRKKHPKHSSNFYGYFYALRRSTLVMLTCFAKYFFWTLCRAFIPCKLTGIWLLLYIHHCSLTLTEETPFNIYFFEWHRKATVHSLMEWVNASAWIHFYPSSAPAATGTIPGLFWIPVGDCKKQEKEEKAQDVAIS